MALRLRRGADGSVEAVALHQLDDFYTTPHDFVWDLTSSAETAVEPGDVLVAYSDGVHECNRGRPGRSIQPHHIASIFKRCSELETFVLELATAALIGVDGHPGGEDNIAVIAVEV